MGNIKQIQVKGTTYDIKDAGAQSSVPGKGLSTNDYTNADKAKLDALPSGADLTAALADKVDKETGKGLSENDYTDEDKAKVDSALQSETDPTVPAWAKQPNKPSYTAQEVGALPANTPIPTALSQLSEDTTHRVVTDEEKAAWNGKYTKPGSGIPASDMEAGAIPDVSNFITKSVDDLVNYYLKSETYTKTEVQNLIAAINQFHYEIAASTSAVVSPASNVLYLIGPTGTGADKYEEYVYDSTKQDPWVKIGDTSIDLSGYVTTQSLNAALANYTTTADLTTLLAGKQDKIDSTHKLDYSFLDNTPTIPDAVEANPTVPAGTTPTDLQNLKVGNDYYAVPEGGDDEAKEVAAAGLCDLDKRIKDILTQVITRSDVRDNLTSPAIAKPLSANQGVVLKKINDDNEEVLAAALCSLYALSAIPAAIAPPYSGSKTYALNDCVTHKTLFWRCTTPVSSPEMFDPNKWTQSSLYEEMLRLLNA